MDRNLLKTLNGLPRELRDAIYDLNFDEDVLVVFGRRGLLPADREGPSHPEETTQMASKYQLVFPGSHTPFGTEGVGSRANSANAPEQA
jgi:hypothetical protein